MVFVLFMNSAFILLEILSSRLRESSSPLIFLSVWAPSTCHPAATAGAHLLSDRSGGIPLLRRAANSRAGMWTLDGEDPGVFPQCSLTLSHLISVFFSLLRLCCPCSSPSLSFCPIKSLFCVLLLLRSQTLELIIACAFPPRHPSSPFHPANSSANLPWLFFFHTPSVFVAYIIPLFASLTDRSQEKCSKIPHFHKDEGTLLC